MYPSITFGGDLVYPCETIITWDEPVKKDPGADYKPGKFKFLDEAIKNSKKS